MQKGDVNFNFSFFLSFFADGSHGQSGSNVGLHPGQRHVWVPVDLERCAGISAG